MSQDRLLLGVEWDPETGNTGKPVTFDLSSHFTMKGPTRCGKGATLEIPNLLLGLHNTSIVSIDPTGQNAAVTAEARRKAGSRVLVLNPMHLHVDLYPDLESCGCNPMIAGLDPTGARFFEEASLIAEAMISVEGEKQKFFPESARGLMTGLIMWVRLEAGDKANLGEVLRLLMEAEETDDDGKPTKGLRYTAALMVNSGHFQIASLAARYMQEGSRSTADIRSTAETAARWLLSDPMRKDLSKNGIEWEQLTETPTTVFVILPAQDLEFHDVWLKLIVCTALNGIYRRAGLGRVLTLMMLSEFFALGKLKPVEAAMGQAAKYGVRVAPVLQDSGQLVTLYGREGAATFIGNSGCLFALAPGEHDTAEFLSRYSGERFVLNLSASQDGQGNTNTNYSPQRERIWPPDKIRSLPIFHGLVWKYGTTVPTPVYCHPYFKNPECMRLARPDPYYRQGAKGPPPRGSFAAAFGAASGNALRRASAFGLSGLVFRLRRYLALWLRRFIERQIQETKREAKIFVAVLVLALVVIGVFGTLFPETADSLATALGQPPIRARSH